MREYDDKCQWELEPRTGEKCLQMHQVFRSSHHDDHSEAKARRLACDMLADNPDLTAVGIYVSHPTPGPVRRFVGKESKVTS